MAEAGNRGGVGRGLRVERGMLGSLVPRSEFELLSSLRPRDAKLLLRAYSSRQIGTAFTWEGEEECLARLQGERLVSSRGTQPELTRLGMAVARSMALGFRPAEDLPRPRLSTTQRRLYRERVYRIRHRNRVVTSNCAPSRVVGDKSIRLGLVELGEFEVPGEAGSLERFIYQDGKGSRLLRERLEAVLPLFVSAPSRMLHPLLYDTRTEEAVLAAFVDGETLYIRLDAEYLAHVRARYGEVKAYANLAELRNARSSGGHVAVAFSAGQRLDALLFGHAKVATDGYRIETALASTYDVVPA